MKVPKKYFVTGIDTDSGKSLVSSILVEALRADYWKPIQAGTPTDSDYVRDLVDSSTCIHPEAYALKHPMSPHAAAYLEGEEVKMEHIQMPEVDNHLVVEGAGGIMVPLNDQALIIDIAKKFDLEVILVSRNYLGSINHTLLSLEVLKKYELNVAGIIFNGPSTPTTEDYILKYSQVKCLGRIPQLEKIDQKVIKELATEIDLNN